MLEILNSKKLFLIDGVGALLSAFLLGVILTRFESVFGMPRITLYFLSILPCAFALYDFSCFVRLTENWRRFIKPIAIVNLLYCCLSVVLVFYHYHKLTFLGLSYFFLELVIVIVLVRVEFKVASMSLKKKD